MAIPAGLLPSDVLVTSPIIHGGEEGAAAAASMGAGGFGGGFGGAWIFLCVLEFICLTRMLIHHHLNDGCTTTDFGGVDAQNDPALAMALRVSYEEERARQEAAAKAAAEAEGGGEAKVRSFDSIFPPFFHVIGLA